MRLTVPSFRSKMIGVFQFLALPTLEDGENKNGKKPQRPSYGRGSIFGGFAKTASVLM